MVSMQSSNLTIYKILDEPVSALRTLTSASGLFVQINSGFACNSVIWVRSLAQNDIGLSKRITDDIQSFSDRIRLDFKVVDISSAQDLKNVLHELDLKSRKFGMRPLLHIDMHGNKSTGLYIDRTKEHVPWATVVEDLRKVNISTGNNLCVVGAACYALHAIFSLKLDEPVPFFSLLAPEEEVVAGFLADNLLEFYKHLLTNSDLTSAYNSHLSGHFRYFHCEEMLVRTIKAYIRDGCKGRSAADRRERLLTEVFMQGIEPTKQNLKSIRKNIKNGLRPDQALLEKYAKPFLIGRTCSVTMEQLLDSLNKTD